MKKQKIIKLKRLGTLKPSSDGSGNTPSSSLYSGDGAMGRNGLNPTKEFGAYCSYSLHMQNQIQQRLGNRSNNINVSCKSHTFILRGLEMMSNLTKFILNCQLSFVLLRIMNAICYLTCDLIPAATNRFLDVMCNTYRQVDAIADQIENQWSNQLSLPERKHWEDTAFLGRGQNHPLGAAFDLLHFRQESENGQQRLQSVDETDGVSKKVRTTARTKQHEEEEEEAEAEKSGAKHQILMEDDKKNKSIEKKSISTDTGNKDKKKKKKKNEVISARVTPLPSKEKIGKKQDDEEQEQEEQKQKKEENGQEEETINPKIQKPGRPMTAYLFFSQELRPKLKKQFPHYAGMTITKELGKMWSRLGRAGKRKYKQLELDARGQYEREVKRWKMESKKTSHTSSSDSLLSSSLSQNGGGGSGGTCSSSTTSSVPTFASTTCSSITTGSLLDHDIGSINSDKNHQMHHYYNQQQQQQQFGSFPLNFVGTGSSHSVANRSVTSDVFPHHSLLSHTSLLNEGNGGIGSGGYGYRYGSLPITPSVPVRTTNNNTLSWGNHPVMSIAGEGTAAIVGNSLGNFPPMHTHTGKRSLANLNLSNHMQNMQRNTLGMSGQDVPDYQNIPSQNSRSARSDSASNSGINGASATYQWY